MPAPVKLATEDLGDVRIHYADAGSGPVLVLLHGWPQSWYCWRDVIDGLADSYRIIAPDLRGLGDSSRPASGYDTRTVSNDIARLLKKLGVETYGLAGHDWGGATAFALAAANRGSVRKLALLDVPVPGDGSGNFSQGGKRWHHGLHQMLDLPEALVRDREQLYLEWFFRNYAVRPEVFTPADIAEYVRTYAQPGAMHYGFEYYRALPQDVADNEESVRSGKLEMPTLGLGGSGPWARRLEVVESLRRVANDVRGGVVADSGHWIPEEQPEVVIREFRDFFAQ